MAEPATGPRAGGASHHPEIDWQAAAKSPEFQELVKKRRSWVLPATIFFMAWYFGFVILAGYAPEFMGKEFLTDGFTVGYALALTQFIMVWVLAVAYVRRADTVFEPLGKKAAQKALEASRSGSGSSARAAKDGDGTGTTGEEAPR